MLHPESCGALPGMGRRARVSRPFVRPAATREKPVTRGGSQKITDSRGTVKGKAGDAGRQWPEHGKEHPAQALLVQKALVDKQA